VCRHGGSVKGFIKPVAGVAGLAEEMRAAGFAVDDATVAEEFAKYRAAAAAGVYVHRTVTVVCSCPRVALSTSCR
jgi:hypothetical protein